MTRALTATALLSIALLAPVSGTPTGASSDPPLQIADLAWERGDYPAALAGYLRLLDSPDAAVLEPIALRTGELYATTELTRDGALPQFSPDGRYLLYETGPVATRVTRVIATAAPDRVVVELRGGGAAFSPDGRKVAYWKPTVPATTAPAAAPPAQSAPLAARATIHDLGNGQETSLDNGTLSAATLAIGAGDTVIFAAGPTTPGPTQIHAIGSARPLAALTSDPTEKLLGAINSTGTALIFTTRVPGAGRGGRGGAGGGAARPLAPSRRRRSSLGRHTRTGARPRHRRARDAANVQCAVDSGRKSRDHHRQLAGVLARWRDDRLRQPHGRREQHQHRRDRRSVGDAGGRAQGPGAGGLPRHVPERQPRRLPDDAARRLGNRRHQPRRHRRNAGDARHPARPAAAVPDRDAAASASSAKRAIAGRFSTTSQAGSRTRLFHNNTVRTIAPEYSWRPSPDGSKLLIVAERDGDTVSLERGVYLMDLTRTVTRQDVRARVAANLAAEEALRAKGARLFAPIAAAVKAMTDEASVDRIYAYEKALFDFDSKHITRPGNKLASAYLFDTYKSFGYSPEYQWFDRANALGGQTANVLATLKGTVNPELIYVVSSHYDSVAIGPGADDDSSGTAALLETARIMAAASAAGDDRLRLVHRRGSGPARQPRVRAPGRRRASCRSSARSTTTWSAGPTTTGSTTRSATRTRASATSSTRAAMQFSNLITYDALYYKSTDAAAYYEAFGDIVGGIGSYPVLGSPHYHQSHDVLENMNHQLVTEVAKTTAATLMLLASSPSRLTDLKADAEGLHRHGVVEAQPGERRDRLPRVVRPAVQTGRAADARERTERGSVQRGAGNRHRGQGGERQGPRGLGLGARDGEIARRRSRVHVGQRRIA